VATISPRPHGFWFQRYAFYSLQKALQVVLIILALLFSWTAALRYVLFQRWKKAGQPKTFRHYVLRTVIIVVASSLAFLLYVLLSYAQYFEELVFLLVAAVAIPILAIFGFYIIPTAIKICVKKKSRVQNPGLSPRLIVYSLVLVLSFPLFLIFLRNQTFSNFAIVETICFSICVLVIWFGILNHFDDEMPRGSIALTWLTASILFAICSAGLWGVVLGVDYMIRG